MNWYKIMTLAFVAACLPLMAAGQTGMVKKTTASKVTEQTETFLVLGNCGMCQNKIQKAALGAGATTASWDADTDQLTITFDPEKSSVNAVQKAVALVGYDNAGYKAPDEAYDNLHGCCKYDRSGAPGDAKPCSADDTHHH